MAKDHAGAILRALEDPRWQWRTIPGIAEATSLASSAVEEFIRSHPDMVVKSDDPSANGEELYASARGIVTTALEDPRWEWRTVEGLASDTRLPKAVIRNVLARNDSTIIKSDVPSTSGEALFTTRKRWDDIASAKTKILGAFKNRRS